MAKLLPSSVNGLTFGTQAAIGVRFGYKAGQNNPTSDTVVGAQAGYQSNNYGTNVFLGYRAGRNVSNARCSVHVGGDAGINASPYGQTSVGTYAGASGGRYGVFIGEAANSATYSENGVSVGANAGQNAGNLSVSIGRRAGRYRNIYFGVNIGAQAGEFNTAGNFSEQVVAGFYTGRFLGGGNNQLHIGWYAYQHFGYGVSGQSTLGRGHNSTGCIWTGWSNMSDCRDKTNIQPLPSELGLNLVRKLRPVKFNWDQRRDYVDKCGFEYGVKDGTLTETVEDYGFLAQEVEFAAKQNNTRLDLVHYDEFNDAYSVTYLDMIASLTKALQEINQDLDLIENHLNS